MYATPKVTIDLEEYISLKNEIANIKEETKITPDDISGIVLAFYHAGQQSITLPALEHKLIIDFGIKMKVEQFDRDKIKFTFTKPIK